MALSTELLRRLNSDEEPLPKRLKLAENVFFTVDIPIARKEDLILQWLCNSCSEEQKTWSSLKSCLKSNHLDVKIDVKKLLVNRLTEEFQEDIENLSEDAFECCKLLVANNGMQQYFVNKPKELGHLIKSLLNCVKEMYRYTFHMNEKKETFNKIELSLINKNNGLMLVTYNTAINVLENMLQIYKSAFNTKDNLKRIFIEDILYPLCIIIDHECTDNTNRFGVVAYKCIQQIIFSKKQGQNGTLLKDENSGILKDLLHASTENMKTKDLQSNLLTLIFIFRAAVGTFKTDNNTLDLIMRELVECAGVNKKEIFNSFLKLLNDITFDFDNRVHGITLFNYCQNIVNDIVLSSNIKPIDYELLVQLACFNPLIIEKKIVDILKKVFMEKAIMEYTNLMITILNTSINLRQEEKLISAILIALKLSLNEIQSPDSSMFFPNEFKTQFMVSINNITNTQGVNILRTLMYHLNTDCMEVLQSNDTCKGQNILMVQATITLLVTFLEGVCVYEYTGTLTSHQKFISNFHELGNVLSQLMDKLLQLNHSKKVIVLLLTAIFSWNEAQKALKYYVPKAITKDLKLPLTENQWQQLIEKITYFDKTSPKNSMNALILQQIKMSQNTLNKPSVKLKNLIGGLEYFWSSILKFDPNLVSLLSNKEISKMANFLLTDMASSTDSFSDWVAVLDNDSLRENERFVLSLLSCAVMQIRCLLTKGVTMSLCEHFNAISLFEMRTAECEKINEVLMLMREEMLKNKWIHVENTCLSKIKVYLEVFLRVPLMYLCTNVRLITFMFIFALKKECGQSDEIISLCNILFADLLEISGLDILQYIDPPSVLEELPHNRIIQKIMEPFLKNVVSYSVLKTLVKTSTRSKKNMYFLLESMQRTKSKVNNDQKAIIKKAEKKLKKAIIKSLPSTIVETDDMELLNLILKDRTNEKQLNEKLNEKLKNVAELTVNNIFTKNIDVNDKCTNKMIEHGIQLAITILRNRKIFNVTSELKRGIFNIMLRYPCTDLLLPLLESTEPKEFMEFLKQLHDETVKLLEETSDNDLESVWVIWNTILKIYISNDRSKFRLISIHRLLEVVQIIVNVSDTLWSSLLKLMQSIFVTKHIHLSGNIIDTSMSLALKSLETPTMPICKEVLVLCNIYLKARTSLITDRLPALLILYRRMLNIIVHKSKNISDTHEEQSFKCFALDVEKFTSSLIKLKKDMIRLTPYLIADLLELFAEASIATFVKASLQNCMNQLMSICDQHGIALLSRTLPVSMQEIFRSQLDTYNKFYKFSGKI